jgi:hypothetical protein
MDDDYDYHTDNKVETKKKYDKINGETLFREFDREDDVVVDDDEDDFIEQNDIDLLAARNEFHKIRTVDIFRRFVNGLSGSLLQFKSSLALRQAKEANDYYYYKLKVNSGELISLDRNIRIFKGRMINKKHEKGSESVITKIRSTLLANVFPHIESEKRTRLALRHDLVDDLWRDLFEDAASNNNNNDNNNNELLLAQKMQEKLEFVSRDDDDDDHQQLLLKSTSSFSTLDAHVGMVLSVYQRNKNELKRRRLGKLMLLEKSMNNNNNKKTKKSIRGENEVDDDDDEEDDDSELVMPRFEFTSYN